MDKFNPKDLDGILSDSRGKKVVDRNLSNMETFLNDRMKKYEGAVIETKRFHPVRAVINVDLSGTDSAIRFLGDFKTSIRNALKKQFKLSDITAPGESHFVLKKGNLFITITEKNDGKLVAVKLDYRSFKG